MIKTNELKKNKKKLTDSYAYSIALLKFFWFFYQNVFSMYLLIHSRLLIG